MTDYERGVEQASNIYKEVIREYVAENAKLQAENSQLKAWLKNAVDVIDAAIDKGFYEVHPDEQSRMHVIIRSLGIEVTDE